MNASKLIMRWVEVYTRGLDPVIAGDRQEELASDLWEHAAHDPKAGGAMLSRAIRGVPADIAWRVEQRRTGIRSVPLETRVVRGAVSTLVALAASALVVLGITAIARTAYWVSQGWVQPWSQTAVSVMGFTALAVIGASLLARRHTRSIGAVALAASTPLAHLALFDLANKSATILALSNAQSWSVAIGCIIGSLVLLFCSAAILWLPARKVTP